jgi:Tol biopolymer transport system component
MQDATRYDDLFATWSPDGQTIAFTSNRTGDPEIYTVRLDGSGLTRLTSTPGRDAHPSFSPDGRRIAFQSLRQGGHTRIFLMNADGSDERALTTNTGFCGVPVWSPDGSRLAFQCSADSTKLGEQDAPWRIYLIDVATGKTEIRTGGPGNDQVPNWSPDGRELVFYSDRSGIDQLYLLELASGQTRQITKEPGSHRGAAFSPDGLTIACIFQGYGVAGDVHLLDRDGSNRRRVTSSGLQYGVPFFSPDGGSLLFQDDTPEGQRIWIVGTDGSNLRRVDMGPVPGQSAGFQVLGFWGSRVLGF